MKTLLVILVALFVNAGFAQSSNTYIIKADSLANQRKFTEAIDNYSLALKQEPENAIYYKRGMGYMAAKNYVNAVKDFSTFIEGKPKEQLADAYFMRGMSLMNTCQGEKCGCPDLQKAKELGFKADWSFLAMVCD